jgi:hypothetical protein
MIDQYIEKLRAKYDQAATQEQRDRIVTVAELVKSGKTKFGSAKYEGNGYCYECLVNEARENCFTCSECAGALQLKNPSFDTMVENIRKMGGRVPQHPVENMSEKELDDLFKE